MPGPLHEEPGFTLKTDGEVESGQELTADGLGVKVPVLARAFDGGMVQPEGLAGVSVQCGHLRRHEVVLVLEVLRAEPRPAAQLALVAAQDGPEFLPARRLPLPHQSRQDQGIVEEVVGHQERSHGDVDMPVHLGAGLQGLLVLSVPR